MLVNKATSAFLGVCGLVLNTESRESGALYVFTPMYKRGIHGFSVFQRRDFPSTGLGVTPEPRFGPGDTEQEQNPDLAECQVTTSSVAAAESQSVSAVDVSENRHVSQWYAHTALLHRRPRKRSCLPENFLLTAD